MAPSAAHVPVWRAAAGQPGGEAALQRLFAVAPAGDGENIVKELSFAGVSHTAVRAGPDFADWAMLDSRYRCISCPSRQLKSDMSTLCFPMTRCFEAQHHDAHESQIEALIYYALALPPCAAPHSMLA